MNDTTIFQTAGELFRKINIVFYSLLGSMFLFLIIALILQRPERMAGTPPGNILIEYVLVILIIVSISGAYIVYILGARRITGQTGLSEKLTKFYRHSVIKLLLFSAAGIFGLIGYVLTAVPLYLAIGFVVIMLMFLHKPSLRRLVVEFKLSQKERELVQSNRQIPS
jgi:hypothetical protein